MLDRWFVMMLLRLMVPIVVLVTSTFGQAQPLVTTDETLLADASEVPLVRFKKQAVQSVSVASGYLQDVGSGSQLSSRFLETSIGTGIPLGSFQNLLGVTPGFRVDWIDADSVLDVPSQLFQFEVQLFYRKKFNERLSAMAIFSPSVRSDLTTSDDAFRVFALGLLNWESVPDRLLLSFGAVYLGRADLPVVPAMGLRWTPNRVTQLDLQFPTSRLSRRLAKDGGRSETWAYVSGGLGGNTWAVTRDNAVEDELTLRDLRLVAGLEKTVNGGGGWFAEFGFATGRRIEYERSDESIDLNEAVVFQAGWRY